MSDLIRRPRRGEYIQRSNGLNVSWKSNLQPVEARRSGATNSFGRTIEQPYLFERQYAALNLLEEVRLPAQALFSRFGIPWHQGRDGNPSQHVRSSQVQCVNALGQMMLEPARILAAFGEQLDIRDVRPIGDIDADEVGPDGEDLFLTFEFTGPGDPLGEGNGRRPTRGANSTSVDAAFAYTTTDGVAALALIEWKYTEQYPQRVKGSATKAAERRRRYEKLIRAANGPLGADAIPVDDLFHEPIYQLVRQQLLAHELESDAAIPADLVRVVHVLSPDNIDYQRSYRAPSLRQQPPVTISQVWQDLLRPDRRDRFVSFNPAIFLDAAITSEEYVRRYGGEPALRA